MCEGETPFGAAPASQSPNPIKGVRSKVRQPSRRHAIEPSAVSRESAAGAKRADMADEIIIIRSEGNEEREFHRVNSLKLNKLKSPAPK